MTRYFSIHPRNPQPRLIKQAADFLRRGAVVYPTDSYYALGCLLGDAATVEAIRRLRGLDKNHLFTLSCVDISQISDYAVVDNATFRLMKTHVPGAYTFVLPATKKVSKHLRGGAQKTVGFRVPNHPVAAALLAEIGEPIISTTLTDDGDEQPLAHDELRRMDGKVAAVIESGVCEMVPTTVIDFTQSPPLLVRQGGGRVE